MKRVCPRCLRELESGMADCRECRRTESNDSALAQDLVTVYEPPDQMAAFAAAALLEERGIRATIKSEQIAMYDGLAMMMRPRWGKLLVLENDRQPALEILEEFFSQVKEDGTENESLGGG